MYTPGGPAPEAARRTIQLPSDLPSQPTADSQAFRPNPHETAKLSALDTLGPTLVSLEADPRHSDRIQGGEFPTARCGRRSVLRVDTTKSSDWGRAPQAEAGRTTTASLNRTPKIRPIHTKPLRVNRCNTYALSLPREAALSSSWTALFFRR